MELTADHAELLGAATSELEVQDDSWPWNLGWQPAWMGRSKNSELCAVAFRNEAGFHLFYYSGTGFGNGQKPLPSHAPDPRQYYDDIVELNA